MTERDLLGFPIVEQKTAKQLPLMLAMGVSINWGGTTLKVSVGGDGASTVASTVDLPDLGPRWARALKRLYPGRKPGELDAKRCGRDLGASPRTAEGWAGGQEPNGKYLWVAMRVHGRAFLALLAPELAPPSAADLIRAADCLRETSAVVAEALARLAKGGTDVETMG